ncbi:3-hydroxyacyl-CoA dehydrogenase [Parahaliea aestuarii]|uniref:3-hydroxyacyl-CoA dehydrogenase n=1 Tax=Parahaliea aestuarii TaxID=1852021 RepID=A0A5C9A147_9GAMM|nr:3-hydroxyacyl-CoA dehydrogenase [Parahaliea aestuarii]TXS94486.1 hypothetical protein FVW59_00775 [Parahaliea aestuarii]
MSQPQISISQDLPSEDKQQEALAYLLQAERDAVRPPTGSFALSENPVRHLGVIGTGTMGGGIAMNGANIGLPVTLIDTSGEALERGMATIRRNYERSAARGRISAEEVERRCSLIRPRLALEDLADCELIIEAVFENMAVKQDIFRRLDAIAAPGAILASNTSALDINDIAAVTSRPESVIGLHFFSPANVMKLLEIVRGDHTAPQVISASLAFAGAIGKVSAVVGVCPGFVGNRILFQRQAQAQRLLLEGARPEQVDTPLRDFGLPMGPFQMSDLAGLDIGWNAETSKGETLRDRLCEAGRRGQKSGAGFYDYDEQRRPRPSAEVAALIDEFIAASGHPPRSIDAGEILARCLLPMINEGAKILQEGVARRGSDIDVIWVYGYGWPRFRGGPMYYADQLGLEQVIAGLEHYQRATGSDFWRPAPLLSELAARGASIADYQPPAQGDQ